MRQRGCFGFILIGIIAVATAAQVGDSIWPWWG